MSKLEWKDTGSNASFLLNFIDDLPEALKAELAPIKFETIKKLLKHAREVFIPKTQFSEFDLDKEKQPAGSNNFEESELILI